MEKNMERKIYELNPSQEVVQLQCKFTLFKKVINIVCSMSNEKALDFNVMKQAYYKMVERNDCMRIHFIKQGGKLKQYFDESVEEKDIPVYEFNTLEEQEKFIKQVTAKPIAYLKGVVSEPYFIRTYDGKYMVLLKVCHLILDLYGLNVIFKDLFDVYDALKNGQELPDMPGQFEQVLINDIKNKHNEAKVKLETEYFTKYLQERETPYYAGIHGKDLPLWQKRLQQKKHGMKMFFIKCDTVGALEYIDAKTVTKTLKYCEQTKYSLANVLFYLASITASKMNGNVKNMMPLELCNCRGTMSEKKCAGTKVQSISCYTVVDDKKTFNENIQEFVKGQNELYRHVGFSDVTFQKLMNKYCHTSLLETLYSIAFSLLPFEHVSGREFMVYSNGKGALPCYLALMYDIKNSEIRMAYDYQTQIITREDVATFHKNYIQMINTFMDNPDAIIGSVKI